VTAATEPEHTCVLERLDNDSSAAVASVLLAALGFPVADGESHAKAEGWISEHNVAR
jgi:hypothetical protein